MKHLTSLITSLVLALAPAGVGAEEHSTTQQAALQYTKSPNRHFSRGLYGKQIKSTAIFLSYSREQICFDLPADVEYMEVDITDANGCMWSGFVSQDDPCCDIPPMSGTAYIEATTDTGATLSATLVF